MTVQLTLFPLFTVTFIWYTLISMKTTATTVSWGQERTYIWGKNMLFRVEGKREGGRQGGEVEKEKERERENVHHTSRRQFL